MVDLGVEYESVDVGVSILDYMMPRPTTRQTVVETLSVARDLAQ